MGDYHHSDVFPGQQEADRKKRLICKAKNVIVVEIWYSWNQDTWTEEILREIKEQTGIEINQEKLNELSNYHGDK